MKSSIVRSDLKRRHTAALIDAALATLNISEQTRSANGEDPWTVFLDTLEMKKHLFEWCQRILSCQESLVAVYGTSIDAVVDDATKALLTAFFNHVVPNCHWGLITGALNKGAMDMAIRAAHNAMEVSGVYVPMFGLPLDFLADRSLGSLDPSAPVGPACPLLAPEYTAPPLSFLEVRQLLFQLVTVVLELCTVGGPGTLYEIAGSIVNNQMRLYIPTGRTHIAGSNLPPVVWIDRWLPDAGTWYYADLQGFCHKMIQIGAANRVIFDRTVVLRVGSLVTAPPGTAPASSLPPHIVSVPTIDAAVKALITISQTPGSLSRPLVAD